MRDPRTFRLRRPVAVRAFPGHPARARPRRAGGLADREARCRPSSTRCSRHCPDWPSTAAPIASPAASSAACAKTRAPGSATCWSTSRSSCRTSPARTSPSARPAAPTTARRVLRGLRVRAEGGRHRRRRARAATCCDSLLPRRAAHARQRCPTAGIGRRARDDFIRYAQRRALGPSTASLVRAAEERDIPWLRLNEQSLVQFGHGKYQQRIQATVTGQTPHIAVELASDKEETNKILGSLGLPVPQAANWCSSRRRA